MNGMVEHQGSASVAPLTATFASGCGECAESERTARSGCERRDPRLTVTIDYLTGIGTAEARDRFGDGDRLCDGVQSMLFAHCGVMNRESLVRRSERILDFESCEPDAGCLWLALLVLVYADRGSQAAAYCEHLLAAARRDLPRRTVEVLILVKARIDILGGRPAAAVEALSPLLTGASPALRGLVLAWLLEALVQVGDMRNARRLACERMQSVEALPDRAHALAARGELYRVEGDLEQSLADHMASGKVLTALNVANPAIVPWRSKAAHAAAGLGRCDLAAALAEDELAAARRWGSPGAVGRALHALGMARQDSRSIATLERAVELLDLAGLRYELMGALCDLGQLYAVWGDAGRSRSVVETATELAVAAGSGPVLQQANSVLGTLDDRNRAAQLTKQELKIADLASRGYSNKSIAETMFLTVRTVEFHLSNVYRKLGIAGRRQLPRVMGARRTA
ncbi:helix-turn-helix transcriptional regulator [Nocardia higoensis]|uniref:helix-turn-helix transcriptional regulator n=1 Tax=Nocardia higoensis TaxID=228599 RepID=UPI0012F6B241|nr:helix-turn-helix transcriptional regulator [Nocardia higoensis]